MQKINLTHDGGDELLITVNGTPVWTSSNNPGVVPLPGTPQADPDLTVALNNLAEVHGTTAVQHMIRAIQRNANGPILSDYLAATAAAEIAALLRRRPDLKYIEARRAIADRWGYSGTSISNFNKIADKGWYATQNGATE